MIYTLLVTSRYKITNIRRHYGTIGSEDWNFFCCNQSHVLQLQKYCDFYGIRSKNIAIYLESKAEGIYPVGFLKGLSRHGLQCRDSRQLRIIPAITAAARRLESARRYVFFNPFRSLYFSVDVSSTPISLTLPLSGWNTTYAGCFLSTKIFGSRPNCTPNCATSICSRASTLPS